MIAPLLTTKLYIPPVRPNLVPRPRLIQRLDEGLQLSHRLTLISAPAGFGKTTLLSEWIHQSAEAERCMMAFKETPAGKPGRRKVHINEQWFSI